MSPNRASRAKPAQNTRVVGRRLLASLIDCLLVLAVCAAVLVPALSRVDGLVWTLTLLLALVLVFCVVYTVYAALFDGLRGATLGKRLLGIRVVGAGDGRRVGIGRAGLRALAFLGTDMFVGVFAMIRSPEHQRPGDVFADTLVVRR